jgi:hypothetical protein
MRMTNLYCQKVLELWKEGLKNQNQNINRFNKKLVKENMAMMKKKMKLISVKISM